MSRKFKFFIGYDSLFFKRFSSLFLLCSENLVVISLFFVVLINASHKIKSR